MNDKTNLMILLVARYRIIKLINPQPSKFPRSKFYIHRKARSIKSSLYGFNQFGI